MKSIALEDYQQVREGFPLPTLIEKQKLTKSNMLENEHEDE